MRLFSASASSVSDFSERPVSTFNCFLTLSIIQLPIVAPSVFPNLSCKNLTPTSPKLSAIFDENSEATTAKKFLSLPNSSR